MALMKFFRIASLSLLVLSASFVAVVPAFAAGVTTQIQSGLDKAAGPSFAGTTKDLPTIIGLVINTLLTFVGVLLLFYLLYAGFLWMTAGGETDKVKKARLMISQVIIGLVIIFSAFAISSFVLNSLAQISTGVGSEPISSNPGANDVDGEPTAVDSLPTP